MIKIIRKCAECPFLCRKTKEQTCNISTPVNRPIALDEPRPSWCPIRKEQIIVRDFE